MFGTLGMPEMIIILVIVLIIFGAGKLPQIGEGVGKALKGFKKEVNEIPPMEEPPPEQQMAGVPPQAQAAPQPASLLTTAEGRFVPGLVAALWGIAGYWPWVRGPD